MGCKQSKLGIQEEPIVKPTVDIIIPKENESRQIDHEIDEAQDIARQQDEDKVKLLLLGTGESGKSTIFKQFRILYGSEKSDEDLKMYGVVVRSNVITAVRKICLLTRRMGHEQLLDEESAEATACDRDDASGMTVREAYDQIVAHLVDNTAAKPLPPIPREQAEQDWVGKSIWAGIQANDNAQLFLQHVEAIRVLWQVSILQYYF